MKPKIKESLNIKQANYLYPITQRHIELITMYGFEFQVELVFPFDVVNTNIRIEEVSIHRLSISLLVDRLFLSFWINSSAESSDTHAPKALERLLDFTDFSSTSDRFNFSSKDSRQEVLKFFIKPQ